MARILLFLILMSTVVSCGRVASRELTGIESAAPTDFAFIGDMTPCYLELKEGETALRVNCFEVDGELHIHSARYSKMPRLTGENWIVTVGRAPDVRIEIDSRIYRMTATFIRDRQKRLDILHNRGYWYAWDGIEVFKFTPRED